MKPLLAYRNGRFVSQEQAGLSIHDAGFVQGATVTDRVRTFNGQPFLLAEHLARFRQSCRLARIPLTVSDEHLTDSVRELLRLNDQGEDVSVVLFATPGETASKPTLGMHTSSLPLTRLRTLFIRGATLLIPGIRHLPAGCLDRRIKHRSRLFWRLAEAEVQDRDPDAGALLLDTDGSLTETAAANLLLVREGRVLTPSAERVLPGISLAFVRGLCMEISIPFAEMDLFPDDARSASEAMLTCTTYCLAPVASIEETRYPAERPIFERLLAAWSERVGCDIRVR